MTGSSWMGLGEDGDGTPDVIIQGAPYDGSVAHDPGAALAPDVLRRLAAVSPAWTEHGVSFEDLRLKDLGDIAVDQADDEATQRAMRETSAHAVAEDPNATLLTLGGDHSITAGVLAGLAPQRRTGILWFDAHPDLMNTFGGIRGRKESRWNHACPLRRILELDHVADEDVLLVGVRDFLPEEMEQIRARGLDVVWGHELSSQSPEGLADRVERVFAECDELYVSFDIDVLDPAFAPGTGVPVPGGMSTRMLLDTLHHLTQKELVMEASSLPPIVGLDLVEISPPADVNRITSRAGMAVIIQMLALLAAKRGQATRLMSAPHEDVQ